MLFSVSTFFYLDVFHQLPILFAGTCWRCGALWLKLGRPMVPNYSSKVLLYKDKELVQDHNWWLHLWVSYIISFILVVLLRFDVSIFVRCIALYAAFAFKLVFLYTIKAWVKFSLILAPKKFSTQFWQYFG